jgi:hypothetical protein
VAAVERAIRELTRGAVIARFPALVLMVLRRWLVTSRVLMSVTRQAAHPATSGRVGTGRMCQQRQRRNEQRNDHENGLHTTHHKKITTGFGTLFRANEENYQAAWSVYGFGGVIAA